jgi:HSP20 family molecular chaperone IbpA
MTVDTTPSAYVLEASLPGYQRDEITLSTRKKRILHVVADGFVSGGGETQVTLHVSNFFLMFCQGHFERRVSFGYDAEMSRVRAEFNGSTLRITVPRRPTPQTFAASLGPSATVGGGSFGVGGTTMFWRGRSNAF